MTIVEIEQMINRPSGGHPDGRPKMSDSVAETEHHQNVREYREELILAPDGLRRSRLITLIAREKMLAEEEGWPPTPD